MELDFFNVGDVIAIQIYKAFFSGIWSIVLCTNKSVDEETEDGNEKENKSNLSGIDRGSISMKEESKGVIYKFFTFDIFAKKIKDFNFRHQLLLGDNHRDENSTSRLSVKKFILNQSSERKTQLPAKYKIIGNLSPEQLKLITKSNATVKYNVLDSGWKGFIEDMKKAYSLVQINEKELQNTEKDSAKKKKRKVQEKNKRERNEKYNFQEFVRPIKLRIITKNEDLLVHIGLFSPKNTIETFAKLSGIIPEETISTLVKTYKDFGQYRAHLETNKQKFVLFQNVLLIKSDESCKMLWYKLLSGIQVKIVKNSVYEISGDISYSIVLHGLDGKMENIAFASSSVERFMLDYLENDIFTHLEKSIFDDLRNGKDIDFGLITINDHGFFDAQRNLIKWNLISYFSKIDVDLSYTNFDLVYVNNKKIIKFTIDPAKMLNYKVFMRILNEKMNL